MKLNRKLLKRMILNEMANMGNFPRPSRQDFVMAAAGVGNALQGMGMIGEEYAISQYFMGLINADYQAHIQGFQTHDDNHYRIMNSVPNPGPHGDKTYPRGNDIMNALRDLGLTYENPRYKQPGGRPIKRRIENDLSSFAAEVADNIASRRDS